MDKDEDQLIAFIIDQGCGTYASVHRLPDGTIVGTADLLYTRAVLMDLDACGYGRRYCYRDRELATRACLALQSGDDEPLPGFVSRRP